MQDIKGKANTSLHYQLLEGYQIPLSEISKDEVEHLFKKLLRVIQYYQERYKF
jgi:uncharacterized protein YggU (UPF0235/DUF167 family)